MKIILVAGVFAHLVRIKHGGNKKVECGKGDDEQIAFERPDLDAPKCEFEPPEVNDGQKHEQRPPKVHAVDLFALGMLNIPRQAIEQPRNTQPDHHADDDPDVCEFRKIGGKFVHVAPFWSR